MRIYKNLQYSNSLSFGEGWGEALWGGFL